MHGSDGGKKEGGMKFGLFYEIPCAPNQSPAQRYEETLAQIELADELGFETAWLAELHFHRPLSIMSAPLLVAAALARRTRRIPLGVAVNVLPLDHPIRGAEETATLDGLSAGRMEFGAGRGALAMHFEGFNIPQDEAGERFLESLRLSKRPGLRRTSPTRGNSSPSARCPSSRNRYNNRTHPFEWPPTARKP